MSQQFHFENLVELCRRTHDRTQRSAARAIDLSLVARNWGYSAGISSSTSRTAQTGQNTATKSWAEFPVACNR